MKRFHFGITVLTVLVFALLFAACASAAEVRPLEIIPEDVDLGNGAFCLTIADEEQIFDENIFTAHLFLEDRYDPDQVKALAPGDIVWMNGKAWTVHEIVVHRILETGEPTAYEIYPEETYYGYLVFEPGADGTFHAVIDDWIPVTPVGEVTVSLPLPDRFTYVSISSGEENDPTGADDFLQDLYMFGGFNAYNTDCVFEDGQLMKITHSSYPEGPEENWPGEEKESSEDSEETPVWKFYHGTRELLETAVITGYGVDCEIGLIPAEMTEEEKEEIRTLALYGVVTGKKNDEMVTGGTWVYSFETPEGEYIMSVELYKGLLVGSDGMYSYALRR